MTGAGAQQIPPRSKKRETFRLSGAPRDPDNSSPDRGCLCDKCDLRRSIDYCAAV
jgi:hypothetical protein